MKLVTLSRSEVVEVANALQFLAKSELPFEIRQCVARSIKSIKIEAEETSNLQKELLDEFAVVTDEGSYKTTEQGAICFQPGQVDNYKAANKKLMAEKVDIKLYQIGYGQLKKVKVNADVEAALLEVFITDDTGESPAVAEKD